MNTNADEAFRCSCVHVVCRHNADIMILFVSQECSFVMMELQTKSIIFLINLTIKKNLMSLRPSFLFLALFLAISCSKKDDPAPATPADKLAGSWSVKEEVTFNQFTGMSFISTKLPTANYTATVAKESATTIKITPGANSQDYDLLAALTVDFDAKTISIPGAVVSGVITDENHFTVTHMWPISSGYYDVVRTFSR